MLRQVRLWVLASLVCAVLVPATVNAQGGGGGGGGGGGAKGGGAGGSVNPSTTPAPNTGTLTNPFDAGQYAGKDKLPEWARDPILAAQEDGELPRLPAKMTLAAALDSLHCMVAGKQPYPFEAVKLTQGQSVTASVVADCPDVRFHVRLAGPQLPPGTKGKTFKVTVSVDQGETRVVTAKAGKDIVLTLPDNSTMMTGKPSSQWLDVPMSGARPVKVTVTVDEAPGGWLLADLRATRPPSASSMH